mmetsp:Transcript_491/g.1038  ORF Transcript_491/g.1038 Transcript_491/m.1038 type:complete len:289 (+) Transcript_491:987-1853(+)
MPHRRHPGQIILVQHHWRAPYWVHMMDVPNAGVLPHILPDQVHVVLGRDVEEGEGSRFVAVHEVGDGAQVQVVGFRHEHVVLLNGYLFEPLHESVGPRQHDEAVLVLEAVNHHRRDLMHQMVLSARVQDAREAAHVPIRALLRLALLVPVVHHSHLPLHVLAVVGRHRHVEPAVLPRGYRLLGRVLVERARSPWHVGASIHCGGFRVWLILEPARLVGLSGATARLRAPHPCVALVSVWFFWFMIAAGIAAVLSRILQMVRPPFDKVAPVLSMLLYVASRLLRVFIFS